jgi:hypothetical protein
MALARPAEREVTRGPATLMDAFLAERARPSEGQSAAGTSEGFGYLLIRSLDPQSVRTEIGQRSGATGAAALHAEETKGYHTGGLVARAAVIPLGSGRRLDHRCVPALFLTSQCSSVQST